MRIGLYLIMIFPLLVTAQENYTDFTEADKEHVFNEDLSFYTYKKNFDDKGIHRQKSLSKTQISSLGSENSMAFSSFKQRIDFSRDFEVELDCIRLGWKQEAHSQSNGLYIGGGGHVIMLGIMNFKGWHFSELRDRKWKDFGTDESWEGYIRRGSNRLLLRKVKNEYFIFHNEILLDSGTFPDALPDDNKVGIVINGIDDFGINHFRVSYLKRLNKKTVYNLLSAKTISYDGHQKIAFAQDDQIKVFDLKANELLFEDKGNRIVAVTDFNNGNQVVYETESDLLVKDMNSKRLLLKVPKARRYFFYEGLPYLFVEYYSYHEDGILKVYSLKSNKHLYDIESFGTWMVSPNFQYLINNDVIKSSKHRTSAYMVSNGKKLFSFKGRGNVISVIPGNNDFFLLYDSRKHKMFGKVNYQTGKVKKMKKDDFFNYKNSLEYPRGYRITEAYNIKTQKSEGLDHRTVVSEEGITLNCQECPSKARNLDIYLGTKPIKTQFSSDFQYLAIATQNNLIVQDLKSGKLFKYADFAKGLLGMYWSDENHLGIYNEIEDKQSISYLTEFEATGFAADNSLAAKSGKCLSGDCSSGQGMFRNSDGSIMIANFDDQGRPDGEVRIEFENGETEVSDYVNGVIIGNQMRYDASGKLLWGKKYIGQAPLAELVVEEKGSVVTSQQDFPPALEFRKFLAAVPNPVKILYPNGNSFEGELYDFGSYKSGVLKHKNGSILKEGKFRGGLKFNTPTTYFNDGYANGHCLEGDCFSGFGKSIRFQDTPHKPDFYIGNFVKGKPHGEGKRYSPVRDKFWDEGIFYEGRFIGTCVSGNCKNGKGKLLTPNKLIRYEGEFVGYKFHGTMKRYDMLRFKYVKDEVYSGGDRLGTCLEGDCQNGYGVIRLTPNNSLSVAAEKYAGTFKNGIPHGNGAVYFDYNLTKGNKANYYKGAITNGKMTGQGIRQYKSGDQVEGRFEDGKLVMQNAKKIRGVTFKGNYSENGLDGPVDIKNDKGDWAKGTYKNGTRHGNFTIYQNGKNYTANFQNGTLKTLNGQPAIPGNEGEYFVVTASFADAWDGPKKWPYAYYHILEVTNCDEVSFDIYNINLKSYYKGYIDSNSGASRQVYAIPDNPEEWMKKKYPGYIHKDLGTKKHDCGKHVHWLDTFF